MTFLSPSKHRELFQNITWKAIHVFGKQGLNFVTFIMCAKLLEPFEFGLYNYIFGIILILVIFGDFGISSATSKFVAQYNFSDRSKINAIPFNVFAIISSTTLLALLLLWLFGGSVLADNMHYIYWALPIIFFAPLTAVLDGIYTGLRRFKELAIISVVVGLFSLVPLYILVIEFGIVGAFVAQSLFYMILTLVQVYSIGRLTYVLDFSLIKEISKYSAVIGIGSIGFILFTRVDGFFLGYYGFIQEVGYYEIANKILIILMLPFGIVAQVIAPVVTEHYMKGSFDVVLSKFKKYLVFAFLGSTVTVSTLFLTKDFIFSTFLHEYYTKEMMTILTLMLLAYFTQMLNGIVPVGFVTATGHAKLSMYFLLVFGLIHVALNFLLIEQYGYIGIIYSVIITKVMVDISFLLFYYFILKSKCETIN